MLQNTQVIYRYDTVTTTVSKLVSYSYYFVRPVRMPSQVSHSACKFSNNSNAIARYRLVMRHANVNDSMQIQSIRQYVSRQ